MLIHLMQHGQAMPKELDPQNPLSPIGREHVTKTAHAANNMGLRFELIVSSPKLRAIQSAEIMARITDYPTNHIEITDKVKAKSHVNEIINFIIEYDGLDSILIVGHKPSLGFLASTLLIENKQLNLLIENAGLMQIEKRSTNTSAQLNWSLQPQQLAKLA